jgi:putative ATP-dependent endonuclease of the OLD family
MTIKSIEVNNLLSLKAAKLDCNNLTTLVGTNGAGKSNFLRALSVFYSLTDAKSLSSEKWFLGETKDPVEITVEFVDLHKEEKERLTKYVKKGTLKVTLRATFDKVEEKVTIGYYGKYRQYPEIHRFRNTKFENAAQKKEAYNKLKEKLIDIPAWTNQTAADDALIAWEETHSIDCLDMEDEGKFFGFKEVGNGNLKAYTRFLYLPAVKDASEDAVEGAGSLLSEISEIVKGKIKTSPALKKLEDELKVNYEATLRKESSTELVNVNKILSEEIGVFLPDFGVEVEWGAPEVKAQLSKMSARLIEKGMEEYRLPLQQQGHGVQRMSYRINSHYVRYQIEH